MAKSSFGQRLKAVFGGARYSVIAGKIGVSEPTIKKYMAGRVPDADKLTEIARVTKCNLHWLLTGEGDMLYTPPLRSRNDTLEDLLDARIRSVVRDELENRDEVSGIDPLTSSDVMIAPVVAHIGPGEKAEPNRDIEYVKSGKEESPAKTRRRKAG